MSKKLSDNSAKKANFVSSIRTPVRTRDSDQILRNSSAKKKICPSTPDVNKVKKRPKCGISALSHNKENNVNNICVAVRVKPPSQNCLDRYTLNVNGDEIVIEDDSNENVAGSCHSFCFDRVFWHKPSEKCHFGNQENIFSEIALPLLNASVDGYNVCLFAYGQTGSGKTYSMMGAMGSTLNTCEAGIVPRFANELINRKLHLQDTEKFSINISYFEIYNEKINDLLVENNDTKSQLKVREHPERGAYIENLSSHSVNTAQDFFAWISMGNRRRATGATLHNERSSRSHTILEISIFRTSSMQSISSKISLVDLAGSERFISSCGNEERFKESLSINKSLLTLGKVVTALSDTKTGNFVPYRDSILTWLLRKSLGGDSRTVMLATISPNKSALDESLATLRWANKARHIICSPQRHEDPRLRLINDLRNEIEQLKSMKNNFITSNPTNDKPISNTEVRKKIDVKEHIKILEKQQRNAESKLKHELEKLELDFKASEKRRDELKMQNEILLNGISTETVMPYHSDYFNHLKHALDTSFSQLNDSNIATKEEDTKIIRTEDSNEILSNLYQMDRSSSSIQNYIQDYNMGNRALVLINIVQKSLTELTEILTNQLS